MKKILSPMATGNGAYILHKNLEQHINAYSVCPYNPYTTLIPPLMYPIGRFNRADIIHTTPDYGIFHKRSNIPLILTFHNYVLDEFMCKYSSFMQSIHYKTDLYWFTRSSVSKACELTAVSHFTADLAKHSLGLEDDITVIYNGVNQNKFIPKKKRNNKIIKVLFCGNLSKRKGVQWLEAIASQLSNNMLIQYTEGLRGVKAGVSYPNLQSIGKIDYEKMKDVYHQADILLFPTVREGFGLVAAEAMACGLPVVASDCSSLPELIDHGKGGFLCPVGDVDVFVEKLNELADNASLRNEMGEYNRVKVEKLFTLDRMIKEYQNLFDRVLDEK